MTSHVSRRGLIRAASIVAPLVFAGNRPAMPAEVKVIRAGFQKGEPVEMTARATGDVEKVTGVPIEWIEFQFGPPMLEAMRAGAIDIGAVGDIPPIFAQAAKADLRYIGANLGAPQSVLLPPGSKIQTLADLKGKKLAFGRGSSAHNFTLLVLEKASLKYSDIEPISLGPADAGAAFERGAIDAWSIWEPYASLFNNRPGVRTLTTNAEIGTQNGFIMASGAFVRSSPGLAAKVLEGLTAAGRYANADQDRTAGLLADATGIPRDVWARALKNDPFRVGPITDAIVAEQQKTADRFRANGLIPIDIKVADIVWRPEA